ncbi:hypothetical protein PMY12_08590 [Clostridium tertium]|jgi:hypothetical protein|uniref:hypothetical protein n=1 Tax=Clostridium tertium TaxID=1559 RepID=UPI0023311FCE|nr:hypothetical protein [Clostridium tertium]MDB1934055.1 hypothetical protein [Clostridium tertium]MDB1937070.1 hypothetical protein [Clostridium tertium]
MGYLSTSLKKEDVFYFTKEVRNLLDLLNGTTIRCNDINRITIIENQIDKIENLLYKYEPTIYEEYSLKTKYTYNNMIKARKEYDRVVAEKCYKEVIEEYKKIYENLADEYKRLKEYRDRLKSALIGS